MARVLTPPSKRKASAKKTIENARPRRFLEENLGIPVGAASKTNKVRWKKPSPVIKRATRTTKRK